MRTPFAYIVARGQVKALELTSGRVRWSARAGVDGSAEPIPYAGPETSALADGSLLLFYSGNTIRRYVPRSGHIVWQRTLRGDPARQAVADGIWYFADSSRLSAYDARTGRGLWSRSFGCWNCGVAASGGRVYAVGTPDDPEGLGPGVVSALDAKSGKTIWATRAGTSGADVGTPVLAGGRLFVRSIGGREGARTFSIAAYRAADGERLWRAQVGSSNVMWVMSPSSDGELIVYPSENGTLYALDAVTGALRWTAPHTTNTLHPALANGLVWAGDDEGRLAAYDARNGRKLWMSDRFTLDGLSSPVVAGGFVLLGTSEGKLLAFHR